MIEAGITIAALLLIVFGKESIIFMLSLLWSSFSLPFFVLAQYEIGLLNTLVEVLGLLAITKMTLKSQESKRFLSVIWVLSILYLAIGFLMTSDSQSATIIFLSAKLFLLPLIFGLYGFIHAGQNRLFAIMYILQILNLIVAGVETFLGSNRLQMLGLDYGTNVRNFDSILRAPGLTLTNYYLGSFSAVCFAVAYSQLFIRHTNLAKNYVRLIKASMLSSLICLLLSSFRTGILFVLMFVLFSELFVKKNFTKVSILFAWLSALTIFAVSSSFFLVDSHSTTERLHRWRLLFQGKNIFYGHGLGSSGAVSSSSYASPEFKIVIDNQYLSFLYQCGIAGLCLIVILLLYLFTKTDISGKSFLVSIASVMFFLEAWDFTLMMSICFIVVFNGVSLRDSYNGHNFISH